MTSTPRIVVRIGRLRVGGASPAEARMLAATLQTSLRAHLGGNTGVVAGGEHIRVSAPAGTPGVRGHAIGARIAAALTGGKGGAR